MKRKITAARRKQLIEQLKKARAARGLSTRRRRPKSRKQKLAPQGTSSPRFKKASRRVKRKARSVNPIRHTPLYIIVAQKGAGPKMHFNGVHFTTNGKPAFFEKSQLQGVADGLVKKFRESLKGYKLEGVPIMATMPGK